MAMQADTPSGQAGGAQVIGPVQASRASQHSQEMFIPGITIIHP